MKKKERNEGSRNKTVLETRNTEKFTCTKYDLTG